MQLYSSSLKLPFFGIRMKTVIFQSCGHYWVFQICWHIEWSTLIASSFRIWESSAGILSPPLALFTVMLPKAHLTSCPRISGCRWVTTPLCLSRSLWPFLYSFSVYSYYPFLISSASVRSLLFMSFIMPIFAWNVPLVSDILEEISSLSHSIVFLYFFALFTCCCCCCKVASVVSNSVRPHRRKPTRLPRPWDSLGKNTGVGRHFLLQCVKGKSESEVTQLCPTLSDPMDCSLPGSSIHVIFQARVLEWGAIAFSIQPL